MVRTLLNLSFGVNTDTAALNGQTWTHTAYLARVAGSFTNLTGNNLRVALYDSVHSYLGELPNTVDISTISGALARYTQTGTISKASTDHIIPYIQVNYTTGQPVDLTLRVGAPQLEQGPFATSVIPTTSAAVMRQPDSFTVPTGAWFNGTTGTWFAFFDGGKEKQQGTYGRVVSYHGGTTALSTDCGNTSTVGSWTGANSPICQASGADFWTTPGGAALAYDENTLTRSLSARGLAPATGAYPGTYDSPGGVIGIGRNAHGTTNMLNGHIQKLRYYPVRASDTQLQLMTQ